MERRAWYLSKQRNRGRTLLISIPHLSPRFTPCFLALMWERKTQNSGEEMRKYWGRDEESYLLNSAGTERTGSREE